MLADAERLAAIREDMAMVLSARRGSQVIWAEDRDRADDLVRAGYGDVRAVAAERDALRARIEAVKVWRSWYATGEAPSPSEWHDLDRRLAGDQPEATPEPCRRCGGDRTQGGFSGPGPCHIGGALRYAVPEATPEAKALVVLDYDESGNEVLGYVATPEPPHLDPLPWVGRFTGHRYSSGKGDPGIDRFDPRPADENGRAYSDKREDYP